jgi:hypothetical protein
MYFFFLKKKKGRNGQKKEVIAKQVLKANIDKLMINLSF